MKTFEINYLNYEGDIKFKIIEVEDDQDEDDAKLKAIREDDGWGDGIKEIIQVHQM